MFTVDLLKVRRLMKEQNLTPAQLKAAGIYSEFVEDIVNLPVGRDVKVMTFEPIRELGAVLKVSPFELFA